MSRCVSGITAPSRCSISWGIAATTRASLGVYNDERDIDRLAAAIEAGREMFRVMDLRELYQDIILDHGRHPRNFRAIEHPTHTAQGYNPLCGDRVTVYLTLDGDRIADVAFQGRGCAISTAAASLMTEVLKGKTIEEARELFAHFHARVTGGADQPVARAAGRGDGAAGALDRGQGLSGAGQMRDPLLACARSRAERRRYPGKDGVAR